MKKLKTQRGITLIALIITIIVMLILVAVTVTVALNGGLFKTAKEATSETEIEKEKELLLEEVMGAMGKGGKVNFDNIVTGGIIKEIVERDENNNYLDVITQSGRKYRITQRGSITLLGNAGGGEVITPLPGGGENDNPDVGDDGTAGLYSADGTRIATWSELLNNGTITVTNGTVIGNDWNIAGKLVILDGITTIGDNAFSNCQGLISVTIPDSVTNIGVWAFCNNSNMTEVNIPSSVTTIGEFAFASTSLTLVTIPSSVTSIGECAFLCQNTMQINVEDDNPNYCSDNGVLYNKNKTILMQYPKGKTETDFTIPDSVTTIDRQAFTGAALTSITIPSSVTNIGDSAFSYTSLTSAIIPSSVASIGSGAFRDCTSLTSVTILGTNVTVGDQAFINVSTVYYAGYVEGTDYSSWGAGEVLPIPGGEGSDPVEPAGLYSPDGTLTASWSDLLNDGTITVTDGVLVSCNNPDILQGRLVISDNVTSIGDEAFFWCTGLTSVIIPNTITSFGDLAFAACTSLTSVTIPNSITIISNSAFNGCNSLTEVNIPDSVTRIETQAFIGCIGLTEVSIPNSVTSIGSWAFNDTSLTSVTIPNSVTTVGNDAFPTNCVVNGGETLEGYPWGGISSGN